MKKVAVIGYGGQGWWHCKEIMKSNVVELSGTFDVNEERNNKAKSDGVFTYESNEAIFNDSSVDIIVIATPNDIHEKLCIEALESGHNVICEKPVTLSVESFDRIIATAKKVNKFFTVHQNRRWDKEFLGIKEIIDTQKLGSTIRIESRVHGSRGVPKDWRLEKQFGGGMIYDWGVHLFDQILTLIPGKIIEVNNFNTYITTNEVDDGFRTELIFENGISANIEVSTYNFIKLPRFYAQFENGTCLIPDWNKEIEVKELIKWNDKDVIPVQTSAGITKTMAPRDNASCLEYKLNLPESDVHDFYRNFCEVIDGVSEQYVKNCEVRRVLQVIEAAFISNEKHERLCVNI